MAKYRHRIFEMYEFRDEAVRALTPKLARPVTEAAAHGIVDLSTFSRLASSERDARPVQGGVNFRSKRP